MPTARHTSPASSRFPRTSAPKRRSRYRGQASDAAHPQILAERRQRNRCVANHAGDVSRTLYPVESCPKAPSPGFPSASSPRSPDMDPERVLLNMHGGGFNSDSGSWTESIPIGNLTKIKVVAVLYRLAPEHPFPAGLDDVIAVYKELLKTYKPAHIAIYGTSAGAILTGEIAVSSKNWAFPCPARSASSLAWAISRGTATPGPCMPSTDFPAISTRPQPEPAQLRLRRHDRSPRSRPLPALRRSPQHAAHPLHHQRP